MTSSIYLDTYVHNQRRKSVNNIQSIFLGDLMGTSKTEKAFFERVSKVNQLINLCSRCFNEGNRIVPS